MGLSNPIWAILSFSLGILLVQHKPEYSVRESYFLTALSIFFTTLVGRIVYTTILYPEFFTPLRHIQTPKASIHTYIQLIILTFSKKSPYMRQTIIAKLFIHTGKIMAQRQYAIIIHRVSRIALSPMDGGDA